MSEQTKIDETRMMISVDPGDVHVGVAFWTCIDGQWGCDYAKEMKPEEFEDYLQVHLASGAIGTVVYESWQLYADKAGQQVGSEMGASQLIGVIKFLVRKTATNWPGDAPQIFKQQAAIKKATTAILKAKKTVSVAKRLKLDPDGHAFDAELHGYHFLGRNKMDIRYPDRNFGL